MAISWPVLSQGDEGLNVRTVQYLLRGATRPDWKKLEADGIFGPKTEAAVREFQQEVKIKVDGIVGQETWTKLIDGQAVKCFVKMGDKGDCVSAAQCQLVKNEELKTVAQIDGDFGHVTDEAVKHFQEHMHLTVDGTVGPRTWQSLVENHN